PNESVLSRRGLFMKIGILFNGVVATALAAPIVGFLLSSVTRGRANGYLSWVPLGPVSEFPEGETRLATFRNPNVMPTDGKTVDTACWVRHVQGDEFLVSAIRFVHVPLPRRSILPRRFARFGSTGTRVIRISIQSAGRSRHDSGWRIAHSRRGDGFAERQTALRSKQ